MRKLALVLGLGLVASIAAAAPATAHTFKCNEVVTGGSFKDVTVPRDGSCTLNDSTVTGKVKVKRGAYFQATGTDIRRGVRADDALTVFIDTGSTVGRSVKVDDTAQVFVFNATVGRDIEIDDASEVVQICGTTVTKGDVEVTDSGFDILVGDPQAKECAGNRVSHGDVEVNHNRAEVEFVVRGNTIAGDLEVKRNRGSVEKFVQDNTGGDELKCYRNESPFTASGNTGWEKKEGQCRALLTCASEQTGVTTEDVVVPADASCTLRDSTVTGNVYVSRRRVLPGDRHRHRRPGEGARRTHAVHRHRTRPWAAASTRTERRRCSCSTRGSATSRWSTAPKSSRSAARRCAMTSRSSAAPSTSWSATRRRTTAPATPSATTSRSKRNDAQVELVVRGNTIGDDLEVSHNSGPVEKFVEDNTGNGRLECFGNEEPFTAARNAFPRLKGQCEVPEV